MKQSSRQVKQQPDLGASVQINHLKGYGRSANEPQLSRKGARLMKTQRSMWILGLAVTALITGPAVAQNNWTGNTDSNNNGGWFPPENWSGLTPTNTQHTVLVDVTGNGSSGTPTRTVSVTDGQNFGRLTMTQTTAGFTNLLSIGASGVLSSNLGGDITLMDISANSVLSFADRSLFNGIGLNAAGTKTVNNAGTINLRNKASFLLQNAASTTLIINNSGLIDATATSVDTTAERNVFGTTSADGRVGSITLNNTGTVDINNTRILLGSTQTGSGSGPNHSIAATFNNNTGGVLNIATGSDNARLEIFARSSSTSGNIASFVTQAGSTTNIGSATATGNLLLSHTTHSGTGTSSTTTTNPRIFNAGTINLNGGSQIAMTSGSSTLNFTFTNQNTGVLNITGTGNIGASSTTRNVLFTNEGTINKTGSGLAHIYSNNASSTATNSGTINVTAGTLQFHTPSQLANSGNITGGGTLRSSGINSTAGNFAAGNSIGTLTLQTNAVANVYDFLSPTTFTFELAAPDGIAGVDNDLIAFTGLNTTGTNVLFNNNVVSFSTLSGFGVGDYTLFTFDQANRYTGALVVGSGLGALSGSFIYNPNSIVLAVIPEPASLALLAAGLLMMLPRRRHAAA
jgi:hypothetical protein